MSTWSFTDGADKSCPQCASTYSVKYHQVPVKDIDSFNCSVCGYEIESWRTTRYPMFTLKEKGEWPKPAP
jgi:transposase-like protein